MSTEHAQDAQHFSSSSSVSSQPEFHGSEESAGAAGGRFPQAPGDRVAGPHSSTSSPTSNAMDDERASAGSSAHAHTHAHADAMLPGPYERDHDGRQQAHAQDPLYQHRHDDAPDATGSLAVPGAVDVPPRSTTPVSGMRRFRNRNAAANPGASRM